MKKWHILVIIFGIAKICAQDIDIFKQYHGRFSYTAIGNTLNPAENNLSTFCEILPLSSADLNMPSSQIIKEAFIYWAGSGSGDTSITLNGTDIEADDTLNVTYSDSFNGDLTYFSCYKNITDLVINTGNGTYTVENLNIDAVLAENPGYCNNRTNFAGWSIFIIYEEDTLPLNQVNLFHGLEIINRESQRIDITISNLNVIDNADAKIGFLAWEGDQALNFGESLIFQGIALEDLPLNPRDNAFNGTNTYTRSSTLYNMDLDVYDIEDIIKIGDTEATVTLTTGDFNPENGVFSADLIIINNIITVLNSQLPDATPVIDNISIVCDSQEIIVEFTVNNFNSTEVLPAGVPISFYANGTFLGQSNTTTALDIGESESGVIQLTVPNSILNDFELFVVVDDDGTGNGTIQETNESNNEVSQSISLISAPIVINIPVVEACDEGNNTSVFNLTEIEGVITTEPNIIYTYYETLEDLNSFTNPISAPNSYTNITYPQSVYVTLNNGSCIEFVELPLKINNCFEEIEQEGISPNDDGKNDDFSPDQVYGIFENLEIKIFNRNGTLVFVGYNKNPWNGYSNRGINSGNLLPVGTYYYVLHLNDPNYSKPVTGWIYLNY
ncbi:gliding motility-associated C-terminal domain-containing protein [Hyunsoonleella flava]|uniref:Gliding motility-associated C-terminal domain-containing protein n=1 Tax=Hyunsoonleella flava TaxID=2527939 RepID=A0A4V2JA63_9FLAO|nr:gliding motility-associated C-terminal domain-containing protein [Hyunsoonleella flava]TBN04305.1 gliding motility-associated C-terminal domain-containing protein [Hyunsoonleella flava]